MRTPKYLITSLSIVNWLLPGVCNGGHVLLTKPVPTKVAVFRLCIVIKKKLYFHLDYISSYRSTKNNDERDWVGSIVHTSYKLGRCSHTEED